MQTNSLTKKNERWYLGDGIAKIVPSDGSPEYLQLLVNGFPEPKMKEWLDDCKANFGGCRWAKMVNDHERSRMLDLVIKEKFSIKEGKPEEKKPTTLIGGETLEED